MEIKPKEKRNDGVTIAKAIAIILMVLGHSGCPDALNNFLGIMRMPLFFIMSGYCFKEKYITDGTKYLKRRVTGVYWPYVKWGLFFLIIHNLIYQNHYDYQLMLHKAIGVVVGLIENEELIGGYWFIHDLFWGSLLFYALIRFLKKVDIVVVILATSALLMSYFNVKLSCFIYPRTALASCFIAFGFAYKIKEFSFEKNWLYITITFVLIAGLSAFWHTSFLAFTWKDIPVFIISASSGSLMIFGIGENLSKLKDGCVRKFLIFTGSNTFNVLTWHMSSFKLVSLLIIGIYGLDWARLYDFPVIKMYADKGWTVLYFIVGVIVPIVGSYVYSKIKNNFSERAKGSIVKSVILLSLSFTLYSCNKDEIEKSEEEQITIDLKPNPSYPQNRDSLRVLAIGNSFTEDATYYLKALCDSSGIDSKRMCVYSVSVSSASIENWINNLNDHKFMSLTRNAGEITMSSNGDIMQLVSQNWDVIVIQQASHLSYVWSNYALLGKYVNLLRSLCTNPNMVVFLQQVWSHTIDEYSDVYVGNIVCSKKVGDLLGDTYVIPTGNAVQIARCTTLDNDMYLTRDNWHLNMGVGRYIASCTWYEKLIEPVFGKCIVGNSARPMGEYSDSDVYLAQDCVLKAVLEPFSLQNPEYKK